MKVKLEVDILVVSLPFKIAIPQCHDIKNLIGALYALVDYLDEKLKKKKIIYQIFCLRSMRNWNTYKFYFSRLRA